MKKNLEKNVKSIEKLSKMLKNGKKATKLWKDIKKSVKSVEKPPKMSKNDQKFESVGKKQTKISENRLKFK